MRVIDLHLVAVLIRAATRQKPAHHFGIEDRHGLPEPADRSCGSFKYACSPSNPKREQYRIIFVCDMALMVEDFALDAGREIECFLLD